MTARIEMRAAGPDVTTLQLYGAIGDEFDGITAKDFRAALKSVKSPTLNLRIDSMGGSVFQGNTMLGALDEFPGRIEVDVDGVAASMASAIMAAGHVVRVAQNGFVMIHDPYSSGTPGRPDDLRRVADLLDKMRGQILDRYAKKAGGKASRGDLSKMMAAETWLTAAEAVGVGLADAVAKPTRVAACGDIKALAERLGYKRVPDTLAAAEAVAWEETQKRKALAASL